MHPRCSAQEVILCGLCESSSIQSHCELCHINLCKACVGEHLSDSSKRHKVVSFKHRKSTPNYPKCLDHAEKLCEVHCEECDIPVCATCVTSGKHKGHDIADVLEKLSAKTRILQKDLEELETTICPRYDEMASDFQTEKANLDANYEKLTTLADQQGEVLHQEITAIVNRRKYDIEETKNKHLAVLNKNTEEISERITELKQIFSDLKSMLEANDVLTSAYESRNFEFRTSPPYVRVTLPFFSPMEINKDQLNEMIGSLSSLSVNAERGDTMKTSQVQPFLTATIDTGYKLLTSVSCLNDEEVWTCGDTEIMKLLNLQGELLTSIDPKFVNEPRSIAVTRSGDFVYTDYKNKTVNLVKNEQIQTIIILQGWRPVNVCNTASDDLLVIMDSDDETQSKVVRYSGSTEKQTIQFDDQRRPLYSAHFFKYISENRNLDICVADSEASAVVVVNQSGKLRFRYTGHPSNTEESFYPVGITTDSQGHILTSDDYTECIHILDQDGQFLRYIQNCDLRRPHDLCVDIRDNLFVAECDTAKVKKIKYL